MGSEKRHTLRDVFRVHQIGHNQFAEIIIVAGWPCAYLLSKRHRMIVFNNAGVRLRVRRGGYEWAGTLGKRPDRKAERFEISVLR